MIKYISILLLVVSIIGCNNDTKKSTASKSEVKTENKFDLPPMPQDEMIKLYNTVTYLDYIFYNLPFSLSQDNTPSIQANLKLMSSDPIQALPVSCKPIGREFFHIEGVIEYEADLYFSDGCFAYVFLKNEKPIYANKISDSGVKFYSNIIKQAAQMQNQGVNGR